MTTLIVTPPTDPTDPNALWDYLLSPDGQVAGEHASVSLGQVPKRKASGDQVVALVPPARLSWHAVQLPAGSLSQRLFQDRAAPRLRAILEGQLEDHLLDDPAQLHFALEPQARNDAPVWVAVCDRTWLRAALQALAQAGHVVSRIVPEFTPGEPALLQVVTAPQESAAGTAQLVAASAQGVSVWPLSSASLAALDWTPETPVLSEPAWVQQTQALLGQAVTLQASTERRVLALQSAWDLAQFDLLSSTQRRIWARWRDAVATLLQAPRWRPARLALLTVVVVNLLGLNAWAWREQAQLQAQAAAIRHVLTSSFPKVVVVVDAPVQMAREVAALQQASGALSPRDLESLLSAVGAATPAPAQPRTLDYAAGALRLQGLALNAEQLRLLSGQLQPLGYSANAVGDTLGVQPKGTP
jgi:general secretion pathway protein L